MREAARLLLRLSLPRAPSLACVSPTPNLWAVGLGRQQALGRNAGSPIKLMPWQPGGPELLSRTAPLSMPAPLERPSRHQALVSTRPTVSLSLVPWVTLNLSLFFQEVRLNFASLGTAAAPGKCLEGPGPASVQAPSPRPASAGGPMWREGLSQPELDCPPPGLGALAS